tara:strand:+ start:35 stop:649 length:615 start_codon:yes stop_codon:yes gene_type:complete
MGTINVDNIKNAVGGNVETFSAETVQTDQLVNVSGDNDSGIDLSTNDSVKVKIANAVKAEVDSSGHVKLDTVKGFTSAASISVVGEGGSTTTNLQQGLIKVWISQDGTASNAAAHDSFNVSGTTDNGTGDYTVTINNDMSNGDYCVTSGGGQKTGSIANNDIGVFHKSLATGQYKVQGTRFSSGNNSTLQENTLFCSLVGGDLA